MKFSITGTPDSHENLEGLSCWHAYSWVIAHRDNGMRAFSKLGNAASIQKGNLCLIQYNLVLTDPKLKNTSITFKPQTSCCCGGYDSGQWKESEFMSPDFLISQMPVWQLRQLTQMWDIVMLCYHGYWFIDQIFPTINQRCGSHPGLIGWWHTELQC